MTVPGETDHSLALELIALVTVLSIAKRGSALAGE